MNGFSFTIPGAPVPKARARAAIHNGRITHHSDPVTKAYEQAVAWAAKAAGVKPISGPVALQTVFWLPLPGSWSKKRASEALQSEKATSRPDLDNYIKSIMDALNGVAWTDDAQVVRLLATKHYSVRPCAEIVIAALADVVDPGPRWTATQ